MKLYTIGKIVGVQGIKGEVKVFPTTSFPSRFRQMDRVLIGNDKTQTDYSILALRDQKKLIILSLSGIATRTQAEALVGLHLYVTQDELVKLPEDHYFIFDLIGLEVIDKKWGLLGLIKDVIEGVQDLYLVSPVPKGLPTKEFLIPAVKDLILEIDLQKKVMRVDLPEGLWEE